MSIVGGITSGVMGSMEASGGGSAGPVGASGGLIFLQTNPVGETASGTYSPSGSGISIKHPDLTVSSVSDGTITADGWVKTADYGKYASVENIPAPVGARVYEAWGMTTAGSPATDATMARLIFNKDVPNGYLWLYEIVRIGGTYVQALYENSATSGGYVTRSTDQTITVGMPAQWHYKVIDYGDRVTTMAWLYEQDTTTVDDVLYNTYSVANRPLKGFYDHVQFSAKLDATNTMYIGGCKISDLPVPVV